MPDARLEVTDALGRRIVPISKGQFEIGRRETNDLRLAGSEVSRDHAQIAQEDNKFVIRDRNSRYGTYVNGVPVPDDYVPEEYRGHDDYGPYHVEEGYYFVLGDHRNSSSDSRHWGPVPKKYVIGKVQLRWWPIPDARLF